MTKLHIKTGDHVKVLTGTDKGKTGKVIQTFPRLQRVVVEGVNISKRHIRTRRQGEKGQIVEFSMPIHVSNVVRTDDAAPAPKKAAGKKKVTKKEEEQA